MRARRIRRSIDAVGFPAYLAEPSDYMIWRFPMDWSASPGYTGKFGQGDVLKRDETRRFGWSLWEPA